MAPFGMVPAEFARPGDAEPSACGSGRGLHTRGSWRSRLSPSAGGAAETTSPRRGTAQPVAAGSRLASASGADRRRGRRRRRGRWPAGARAAPPRSSPRSPRARATAPPPAHRRLPRHTGDRYGTVAAPSRQAHHRTATGAAAAGPRGRRGCPDRSARPVRRTALLGFRIWLRSCPAWHGRPRARRGVRSTGSASRRAPRSSQASSARSTGRDAGLGEGEHEVGGAPSSRSSPATTFTT